MDRGAMEGYVKHAQSIIDSSPQMDEANTKAAILRDFIELLNWEIPTNTQLEYPVEAFGQTYKVDYALILESNPVAFLEAKGADTALTEKHNEQLSSYMTNKNVNYGILANAKRYRFFERHVDGSDVDVQMIGDVELQNLPDRLTVLNAYTKDKIETDESKEILGRITELREAQRALKHEKEDVATEIVSVLSEHVSEHISSIAESQSKEMIDRLIKDIGSEIDPDSTISSNDDLDAIEPTGPTETSDDVEGYVIEILTDGSTLTTFTTDNQTDAMVEAVDHLIDNRDLLSKIEPLPYIPGREKAIINDEPTSPHNEDAMIVSRELTQGYYIDTNMNKEAKQRHLERLAKKCNVDINFRGAWS